MLWPFVWDYPGKPVPEETFTRSHLSWSSILQARSHFHTIHYFTNNCCTDSLSRLWLSM